MACSSGRPLSSCVKSSEAWDFLMLNTVASPACQARLLPHRRNRLEPINGITECTGPSASLAPETVTLLHWVTCVSFERVSSCMVLKTFKAGEFSPPPPPSFRQPQGQIRRPHKSSPSFHLQLL